MNGRAYDAETGRFLSVDPFMQSPLSSQSLNPYSYVMNNPVMGTDPTGYISTYCGLDKFSCEGGDNIQPWERDFNCQKRCQFDSGAESAPSDPADGAIDVGSLKDRPPMDDAMADSGALSVNDDKESGDGAGLAGGSSFEGADGVAKRIYQSMCVTNQACKKGVNFFGFSDSEKKQVAADLNALTTDKTLYNTDVTSKLIQDIEADGDPIIFAHYPGKNQAVPVRFDDSGNGKGTPVVILVDFSARVEVTGIRGGAEQLVKIPRAEIVLHELFHASQMQRGNISWDGNAYPKKYGTSEQWEIDAVDFVNSARKTWQRTEYYMDQ